MPTYDFLCLLGHKAEARVSMDTRVLPCPVCGAPSTRQFTVTDPGRIRITEGFRTVTRSDVVAERPRKSFPTSPLPPVKGWAGGFGHTKVVPLE